jgi:hypothetical protein
MTQGTEEYRLVGHAPAETINGLYKADVIHRRGPWRSFEAVKYAILEWEDWFNNCFPADAVRRRIRPPLPLRPLAALRSMLRS